MLGFWPWYQDWRTGEEIKRSKRLGTLVMGEIFKLGRKKKYT